MSAAPQSDRRPFNFDRDTFAFPNELVWAYRFDAADGKAGTFKNEPPPAYAHRCFVMVRSARQFFYHARFDPDRPPPDELAGRKLIRAVVARSPRQPSPETRKIVVPGYDSLRAFSRAREGLLKAECGGAWQSYVLRSHWRMVFPISRPHQARMAAQVQAALTARPAPILHVVRFPALTINHALLAFGCEEVGRLLHFGVYDPNVPGRPAKLTYDRARRTFFLPRNHDWAGGQVDVIEVYRGWFY
jgi:hypothetical protein